VNAKDAAGGDGATQLGRALTELSLDILCANSPQAKGRVEHASAHCRTGWSKNCV
jgi:hypothetical protein